MTPSKSWPHLFRLKFTTYEALSLPSRSSEPNSRIRTPGTRYNVINTRSFSRSNIEAHFHTAVQGHTTDPHFKNALLKNASRNDSKSWIREESSLAWRARTCFYRKSVSFVSEYCRRCHLVERAAMVVSAHVQWARPGRLFRLPDTGSQPANVFHPRKRGYIVNHSYYTW